MRECYDSMVVKYSRGECKFRVKAHECFLRRARSIRINQGRRDVV